MHAFRLGKAPRATNQPLPPGPEMDGLALDVLPVLLADLMLLGIDMPLMACQSQRGGAFACTKPPIASSSERSPRHTSSASARQLSTSPCSGCKNASTP